jgi:hypothetical protein
MASPWVRHGSLPFVTWKNGDILSPRNEPHPMGPEKGWLHLSYPPSFPFHWRLLGVSPLARLSLFLTPIWLVLSSRLPFLPLYIIPLIPIIVTSALKMEKVRFSEMLASTKHSTRHLNPEYHHHNYYLLCIILQMWDLRLWCHVYNVIDVILIHLWTWWIHMMLYGVVTLVLHSFIIQIS